MASYKWVLLLERTNVSPSAALNEPDSLMADLTTQLAAKIAAEPVGTVVDQYQLSESQAGGRRHYVLLKSP